MNKEELIYLTAFKKIENVGDKTIDNLHRRFTSFKMHGIVMIVKSEN